MTTLIGCCNIFIPNHLLLSNNSQSPRLLKPTSDQCRRPTPVFAAKSGGFSLNSILKGCDTCSGKGAIECPGCKGTGKNKKNGNIFERWKCFDCQGFGLKSCPNCGKGGLTPEQRGER
ncbi:uncharacterized protein LOC133794051 [Humulus lupulus]|uniref:uncharacterized protein LOC133794051 n=1 Tax=Humulus lupulus TaxID=3486 RepID=UPI002B415BF9|nr:uncharacterized protein LOC133794051 [Humulus lupulus]